MFDKKATDEAVFAAADALFAETGKEPPITVIQERTGGSYTTIRKALTRWETSRGATAPQAPSEVIAKADLLANAIWAIAKQQADHAVQDARRLASLEAEQAGSHLAHAEAEITRLERELRVTHERLAQTLELVESERTHAETHARHVEELRTANQRAVEACEQVRMEARQSDLRAATLEGECVGLQRQMSELLASMAARPKGPAARSTSAA